MIRTSLGIEPAVMVALAHDDEQVNRHWLPETKLNVGRLDGENFLI